MGLLEKLTSLNASRKQTLSQYYAESVMAEASGKFSGDPSKFQDAATGLGRDEAGIAADIEAARQYAAFKPTADDLQNRVDVHHAAREARQEHDAHLASEQKRLSDENLKLLQRQNRLELRWREAMAAQAEIEKLKTNHPHLFVDAA